jgi:hypothetical protein
MDWVWNVLKSEFFWGIIVGLFFTVIGSYSLAFFAARRQRQEQKKVLKSFCIDTVTNIRQIVDDMNATRSKVQMNHYHYYLALLDIENQVFSRNREHLISLPHDVREKVRKFVADCVVRRAEIGNHITTFMERCALADQFEVQRDEQHMNVRKAATDGPLAQAHKAIDALVLRAKDSDGVIKVIASVR